MQYEQLDPETRVNLPRPSIDTGMGLERIAAVLQGVHDNYDTDTFKALIAESGELTKTATTGLTQANHRVIADHLRSSGRSEEHPSELQSLLRISYAAFCLKKKKT